MNYSLRTTIRGRVAPDHRLSCSSRLWRRGLNELHRRGQGERESGAFLLGEIRAGRRCVRRFVFYDDLDAHCLDSGIVIFDGAGFGPLWQLCRETGWEVIADVHTHPGAPWQSAADRDHPMVAQPGHIALIVPRYARQVVKASALGIYAYRGDHCWCNHSGPTTSRFFYIGWWG